MVMCLRAFITERSSGVESSNVPDECLGWVIVEIGEIVRKCAAMEGIAGGADLLPEVD